MVSATDSQLRGVLRRLNKAGQQIGNLSQHNLHLKREIKSLRDNATRVSEFDPAGTAYRQSDILADIYWSLFIATYTLYIFYGNIKCSCRRQYYCVSTS